MIGLVLSCDFLNVTNANDESFNGEYGLSPLVANGAPDKDVYEKQDGSKVIFWKNGEWAIGPNTSVTTGEANYGGIKTITWIISRKRRYKIVNVISKSYDPKLSLRYFLI